MKYAEKEEKLLSFTFVAATLLDFFCDCLELVVEEGRSRCYTRPGDAGARQRGHVWGWWPIIVGEVVLGGTWRQLRPPEGVVVVNEAREDVIEAVGEGGQFLPPPPPPFFF